MAGKIRVYGKAQNRTALGIMHAYMTMYPHATLEDIRRAFPNDISPDKGVPELFLPLDEAEKFNTKMSLYFAKPNEVLTMGNGSKVAVAQVWSKPSFERAIRQGSLYDIEIAQFDPAEKGFGKKGSFALEMLNGYVPPVPEQKKKGVPTWLWAVLGLILLGVVAWFIFGGKSEPQIVEVEKIVEKEVIVRDTVYVQQIEDIERNFNAAQFEQGKSDLNDDAKLALHDLAKVMKQNPELKLTISGHTSSEGDDTTNQKLSEARAQAAVDFLVNKEGIDSTRLSAKGYGSSKPVSDNPDENRRTEFEITD